MERDTQQRRAIRAALERAGRPLSPAEVLDFAKAGCPGLGTATVYRNLKALLAEEWLAQVDLPRPRDLEVTYTQPFQDTVHELRSLIGGPGGGRL